MTAADHSAALTPAPTRRHLLKTLAALGVGSAVFQRALAADAEKAVSVTPRWSSRPNGSPV